MMTLLKKIPTAMNITRIERMRLNRHTLFIPGGYYRFSNGIVFKIIESKKDADLGDNDRCVTIKLKGKRKEKHPLSFIRSQSEAVPDIIGLIEVGE